MPRTLNGTIATDLAGDALTLCRVWQITRTDGVVVRLTDHDQDVTFMGATYLSDGGFTISSVESGENLAVDNAELKVLLSTTVVDQSDILAGLYDNATVKVWLVNYEDLGNYVALPGAYLQRLSGGDTDNARFELVSISSRLNQNTGRIVIPTCNADVGDSRCGVNLAGFTVTGTLTGVTSTSVISDSSRGEADDHFNYGVITMTSGNNNGLAFEVKDFGSGEFTLQSPAPNNFAVGDTYSVHRGCDRRRETCRDVFSNIENFRGFPFNVDLIQLVKGPQ